MKLDFQKLLSGPALSAAGVFCAGLLLVEVNVLSARHYDRLDATEDDRYTLSAPTTQLVRGLKKPVEVTVLLASGDPLLKEVQQILTAYQALTPQLQIRYVDPDQDTAEFLALSRQFNLGANDDADGAVVSDTALFLRSGERTWFIRGGQLAEIDQDGNGRLRIEARLTEGLARLDSRETSRICFVTGHGERSIDDSATEGLVELRRVLERSNVTADRVPLDVPDPAAALKGCDHVAIVGPERPWPESHTGAVLQSIKEGASALFFLDPIVNSKGQITDSGLGQALKEVGVVIEPAFVLEQSPEHRLPSGIGEAFFPVPKTHPLTQGLSTDAARLDARVVILAAQQLRQAAGAPVAPLLQTTERAVTIRDLNRPEDRKEGDGPLTVAYASQKRTERTQRRSVVVGSSNVLTNASFVDPSLYGSRVFAQNAFSWVLEKDALVAVPEKPPAKAGLNFTEDSLSELLRYVLIYMPLTAASLGAFVIARRRKTEGRSHPGGEAAS